MKIPRPPHNWSVSPVQAIAIQKRLAALVRDDKPTRPFRYIAGVDAAFSADGQSCLAGAVLWDMSKSVMVEQQTAIHPLTFPYIPGLLTFREAPALIAALRKLRQTPDCLICDGQGVAHPRRCGIATHLGLIVHLPAIGCAKSRLIGDYKMPAEWRGAWTPLTFKDEVIGAVLRSRDHVRPLFISIGNNIDLGSAMQTILACGRGYRLPEPTRLADQLVGRLKREISVTSR
ncbi:MAG: deoxyribonuclease V [Deltaproteobacteria bacterium]